MTRDQEVPAFLLRYEWERWAPGEYDPEDCNSEVTVTLEDGRVFVGTFFTLTNIQTLLENWARTGEYGGGMYFWAPHAVIVRRLDEANIRVAVADLLRSGALEAALKRVKDA